MKTAIYIEDGRMQLVLTPETDYEEKVVKSIADKPKRLHIQQGQFYACRGGWTRHTEDQAKQSLIVVLDEHKSNEVAE